VPPVSARPARHDDRDELTRQLTGFPFPLTTDELREVGVRLLLPRRVLEQLDRLPLHRSFSSPADVRDHVESSSGARPRPAHRRL
jgi:hypothetical protein